jgi:hypothetical protein
LTTAYIFAFLHYYNPFDEPRSLRLVPTQQAPVPDHLNYSQWIEDPELQHETCCHYFDALLCCTNEYNGTEPKALRFVGAAPFDAAQFFATLGGRHIAMIGDSIMRQTTSALVCALEKVKTPLTVGKPTSFKASKLYDFAATYEDGTKISRASMTRFDFKLLHSVMHDADILMLNIGAWYNPPQRQQYGRDMSALGDALRSFNRRPGKRGILVDTVPQHFPTQRGSGAFSDRIDGKRCVPVDPGDYSHTGADWHTQVVRRVSHENGLQVVEVLDIFVPRWDAHLESRPKTATSGSGNLDCTHYCHRDSVWEPLLSRIGASIRIADGG